VVVHDHGDALDFDLFDRWRIRLRDVHSTIGWDAVALFLRHLPYDSETMRELEPSTAWSREMHLLVGLHDLIGDLFAQDYEHLKRPGSKARYESTEAVARDEYDKLLEKFRGGVKIG